MAIDRTIRNAQQLARRGSRKRRKPAKPKITGMPLGDRVIVVPIEVSDKAGTLHIPEQAQQQPDQGTVVLVGPGALAPDGSRLPMEVRNGDTVIFSRHSGSRVNIGDVQCLVMREEEIIMRFPKGSI